MSQIAIANAFFRARESALPAPDRILDDPFAVALVRSQWRLRALWVLRRIVPGLGRLFDELQTVHCVRHASVDALVRQSLERGVRQIVMLGAGLDARAERLGSDFPEARWWEVDRSPYIAHKRDVLRQDHGRVVHVTADLSVHGWTVELLKAGLDRDVPTLWVAEGLIHYLPVEALAGLLHDARDLTPSPRLVISFIRPEVAARADGTFIRVLRWLREVPMVFFSRQKLEDLAQENRWSAVQTWDFDQQVQEFAPAARARPHGLSQDVALFYGLEETG